MSVLDILIQEVSKILGISKEEVLSRFTKEELDDLLNNSLCEQSTLGSIPFDDISCPPEQPSFLSDIELTDDFVKSITDEISNNESKTLSCIQEIDTVNKKISERTKKYLDYKILLDKLIEYRDNLIPIKFYYEERAKESAKLFSIFSPLLEEIKRLEELKDSTLTKIRVNRRRKAEAYSAQNYELADSIGVDISRLESESISISKNIRDTQEQIIQKEKTIPIFNSSFFTNVISSVEDSSILIPFLRELTNNFIDPVTFNSIKRTISKYSECIQIGRTRFFPRSIQESISQNYITFNIDFPGLNYITLEDEKYDESTSSRSINKVKFKIKNSSLLKDNSFFNSLLDLKISEFSRRSASGTIYEKYYNLLEDPINNFFTLDDRGLTNNIELIDARVKGTSAEKKKEGIKEYFIKNIDTLQQFYQNFEESLNARLAEVREQVITPAQETINETMRKLAKQEVQLILALGGVSRYLPKDSQFLDKITTRLESENSKYLKVFSNLQTEIIRIEKLLDELKLTPDKVKKLLKETNSTCFEESNSDSSPCPDTLKQLGSDPLGLNYDKSSNSILPGQDKFCYWLEFSKLLNVYGLTPIPNLPNLTQLRYWPVGFVIASPSGLVKIPLPIIYVPLIVFSSPLGNIVLFLTINGLFISPIIFLASSSGFKQIISSPRGPSRKFGYDSQDESVKSSASKNVFIEASIEKARKKILELTKGKNYHLSDTARRSYEQSKKVLQDRLLSANSSGNEIEQEKIKRKLTQLDRANENLGFFEKLELFLNKKDSAEDLISDFTKSLRKSFNKLGFPEFRNSQNLKLKIIEEREKQRAQLREALISGDYSLVSNLRKKIKLESVDISTKIESLEKDLLEYFNKIKFPKVRIPKNKEIIDPKPNSIITFIEDILDFSELYGTQFFSVKDIKIKSKFLKEVAKANNEILDYINDSLGESSYLELKKDKTKINSVLLGITDLIFNRLKGKDSSSDIKKTEEEIQSLKTELKTETDPVKKKKINLKLRKLFIKSSNLFSIQSNYAKNGLNSSFLEEFKKLKVDFNPYSPCCQKTTPSIKTDISESSIIFEIAKTLLFEIINNLNEDGLFILFGGKSVVSNVDIRAKYISLVKKIPEELELPIPSINVKSFLEIFSKILIPLFEIKSPMLFAQPSLPKSIVIDLNILKKPLLNLLLKFFRLLLPDFNQNTSSIDQFKINKLSNSKIDDNLIISSCDQSNLNNTNSYTVSKKSVYPTFQNIENRFIDINPEDLLSLIVIFFDLKLSSIKNLLTPFYSLINLVKPTRRTNLNIIENAQYKIPPYGPLNESKFIAYSKYKQFAPNSSNFRLFDVDKILEFKKAIEPSLIHIINSPLPYLLVASAGAVDSISQTVTTPKVNPTSGEVTTSDSQLNKLALRKLHPILNQDDLPPWERLSLQNILFLLFLDDFAASAADKLGFFRNIV